MGLHIYVSLFVLRLCIDVVITQFEVKIRWIFFISIITRKISIIKTTSFLYVSMTTVQSTDPASGGAVSSKQRKMFTGSAVSGRELENTRV